MHQRGFANGYSFFKVYENFASRGYGPGVIFTGLSSILQARLSYLAVRNTIYKVIYDLRKPVKVTNDLSHREKGLIAAVAGAAGAVVSNPFECAAVRKIGDLGRDIRFVRSSPAESMWAGLGVNVLRAALFNAFAIYIYDQTNERYWNTFGETSFGKPWACACVAAFAWAFVLPVDALKTRLQYRYAEATLNRLPYPSLPGYIHRSIINEGLNTFHAGGTAYFLRTFFYSVATIWLCDLWVDPHFKSH